MREFRAPGQYIVNTVTMTVVKVSFRDAKAPAATVKKIAKVNFIFDYGYGMI
jgi:hypothetical protein